MQVRFPKPVSGKTSEDLINKDTLNAQTNIEAGKRIKHKKLTMIQIVSHLLILSF